MVPDVARRAESGTAFFFTSLAGTGCHHCHPHRGEPMPNQGIHDLPYRPTAPDDPGRYLRADPAILP